MTGNPQRLVSMLWSRLHEPRAVTAWAIIRYALAALIGVGLLVFPPDAPMSGWALVMGVVVSAGLAVASSAALVAAWRGVWWAERVAIIGIACTYAAQVPMLWPLFDTVSWHFLITASVLEACAALGVRYFMIRWAYVDPMR